MRRTPDTIEAGATVPDAATAARSEAPPAAADQALVARRAEFFATLQKEPYRFDFFQVMRRIETLYPGKPRFGLALRPIDEPLRFAQAPQLSFAPSTISNFQLASAQWRYPRMEVRFFGLLGPNGPLPLHLTEYARERLIHRRDRTFTRFLDVFHHRYIALFYRAWAQAQPTVSLDRPRDDRYSAYVGALLGLGMPSVRERDAVPDHAKLFYAGLLSRSVRNSDGLAALLSGFFRIPVRIEQFVGHWLTLPVHDRTRLGRRLDSLGGGAMLGSQVWDRQHKFRIWIGPLDLAQYESFLPGGGAIGKIVAWVRQYVNFELDWDLRLVLIHTQVPHTRLGGYGRLGWTTWLGKRAPRTADVDDLKLNPEGLLHIKHAATEKHGAPF